MLQAAVHVFARDGIDAASISDIAEEAGVAKGSVYLYFDSKETLAGDLVAFIFGGAETGPMPSEDPDPLDRIVRFCSGHERSVLALGPDAPLVCHMLGHTGKTLDDHLARGVRQLMAESCYFVELLLRNARERGQVPPEVDVRYAAASILAVTFGTIHSRLAHGATGPDYGISVARNVAIFLRGLGAALQVEQR